MTLDELKALAEKAKAMDLRSKVCHRVWRKGLSEICELAGNAPCQACIGAQRAMDDIARKIMWARNHRNRMRVNRRWFNSDRREMKRCSSDAARIASYFCSEPNPVSEFRDAVQEFCR